MTADFQSIFDFGVSNSSPDEVHRVIEQHLVARDPDYQLVLKPDYEKLKQECASSRAKMKILQKLPVPPTASTIAGLSVLASETPQEASSIREAWSRVKPLLFNWLGESQLLRTQWSPMAVFFSRRIDNCRDVLTRLLTSTLDTDFCFLFATIPRLEEWTRSLASPIPGEIQFDTNLTVLILETIQLLGALYIKFDDPSTSRKSSSLPTLVAPTAPLLIVTPLNILISGGNFVSARPSDAAIETLVYELSIVDIVRVPSVVGCVVFTDVESVFQARWGVYEILASQKTVRWYNCAGEKPERFSRQFLSLIFGPLLLRIVSELTYKADDWDYHVISLFDHTELPAAWSSPLALRQYQLLAYQTFGDQPIPNNRALFLVDAPEQQLSGSLIDKFVLHQLSNLSSCIEACVEIHDCVRKGEIPSGVPE